MFLENGTILKISDKNNIKLINLTNFKFNLPINGFLKSRLFFIFLYLLFLSLNFH